jgi:uncharacterized iron-regulated protein
MRNHGITATVFLAMAVLLLRAPECPAHDRILRISDMRVIPYERLVEEIGKADIVLVGEEHNNEYHHRVQLDILRSLKDSGHRVAVGLEMFRAEYQSELFSWVKGETTVSDFREIFRKNWDYSWHFYKNIFMYTKKHSIPLIGLNVPRKITIKVAREGFSSLTRDELMRLPMGISCDIDEGYMEFMRTIYRAHGDNGNSFVHFCEAQLVWDKVMAWYLVNYLNKNPYTKLVVLAGANHSWKKGIPEQIRRQSDYSYKVIFPSMEISSETMTPEYLDYLLVE